MNATKTDKKKKITFKLYLDIKLPPPPMAGHWVTNVFNTSHLTHELWHWAILFDCLSKNSLCPQSLV